MREKSKSHNDELIGSVIADLRKRLLDLSDNNRLLNFKFSDRAKNHIRAVDELPDVLYEKLIDKKQLLFSALPEPKNEPKDEKTDKFLMALKAAKINDEQYLSDLKKLGDQDETSSKGQEYERALKNQLRKQLGLPPYPDRDTMTPAEYAKVLKFNPSYDLPLPDKEGKDPTKHTDKYIQTLLFPDQLDSKLSTIQRGANTSMNEMGVHSSHISFGFLEWYVSDTSDKKMFAPLLLHQIKFEKSKIGNHKTFCIETNGEETFVNLTLKKRMIRDFDFVIPDFDAEDNPEIYFNKINKSISKFKRWKLWRFVTVGLFAFGRIAMYQDLDPDNWDEDKNLAINPIIKLLLGSSETSNNPTSQEYEVDAPEISKKVPLLIADADSSQFSAIADAMDGNNLAIKGPPGTGKSQTITNLIAASMAAGKKILFIAEKMAALNVVKKRLDGAKLGDFVLELHSTKSRKLEVLQSLEKRRKKRVKEPKEYDNAIKHLTKLKKDLSKYSILLNQAYGESGRSIQEIIWGAISAGKRANSIGINENIQQIVYQNAKSDNIYDINDKRDILKVIERIEGEFSEEYGGSNQHPWSGTNNCLSVFEQENLLSLLKNWTIKITDIANLEIDGVNFDSAESLADIKSLVASIQKLPEALTSSEIESLNGFQNADTFSQLEDFIKQLTTYQETLKALSTYLVHPNDKTPSQSQLLKFETDCSELTFSGKKYSRSMDDLQKLLKGLSIVSSKIDFIDTVCKKLNTLTKSQESLTLNKIESYLLANKFLAGVSKPIIKKRLKSLYEIDAKPTLKAAKIGADKLLGHQERLEQSFHILQDTEPKEYYEQAAIIRSTGFFSQLFSKQYSKAKLSWQTMSKADLSEVDHQLMAQELEDMGVHIEKTKKLTSNEKLINICGPSFNGLETDFEGLLDVCDFHENAMRFFSENISDNFDLQSFLLHGTVEQLESFSHEVSTISDLEPLAAPLTALGIENYKACDLVTIRKAIKEKHEQINMLFTTGVDLGLRMDFRVENLQDLKSLTITFSQIENAMQKFEMLAPILGKEYLGPHSDIDILTSLADHVRQIKQSGLPIEILTRLMTTQYPEILNSLNSYKAKSEKALENEELASSKAIQFGNISVSKFFKKDSYFNLPLYEVKSRVELAIANSEALPAWVDYLKSLMSANKAGLSELLDLFNNAGLPPNHLEVAFNLVYHRSLLKAAFQEYPEIKNFSGTNQDMFRKSFQKLDKEIIDLERENLACILSGINITQGNSGFRRSEDTGLALIRHEVSKKKRHIPLRDLFNRAGQTILDMKPCWMMSPASVAQYLIPGGIEFDIVIFDEASQMKPEDAIGSIARGKQLVVVGDPEQLPPTSFFDRIEMSEAEDEEFAEERVESESILDLTLNKFSSSRELRWHYRSRHESLIAFSNYHFYRNSLIVFPSPYKQVKKLGVEFHRIEDGFFNKNRVNIPEASVVAQEAVCFMMENAGLPEDQRRSLGIVTINQSQREILDEEITRQIYGEPLAQEYIQFWENSLEPFFVKNLENVQGDERDTIFISMVYGKNETGKVLQRFGPINSKSGHRRLNVLFTRAKERVTVFSSMDPTDIIPSETSNKGVIILKNYLEYSISGNIETGQASERDPDSDFEIFVADALRHHGYKVDYQIGEAGFFIDIGVKDPNNPNKYLCGIECDGATYHSAKSARDRDRLRQEALENLGWEIYRIWSTDWFSNPDSEIEKCIEHLKNLPTRPL